MNDQQRTTPQPFDDGPRSAVDPHLLPASARQQRSQVAESDAPVASSADDSAESVADSTTSAATSQAADTAETIDPAEFLGEDTEVNPEPATVAAPIEDSVDASEAVAGADEAGEASTPAAAEPAADDAAANASEAVAAPERSRLDEALERSRTIPYEAPVPPAADDETVTETAVLDTEYTEAVEVTETVAVDEAAAAEALREEERRRDDEAFEEAMLGTTSTEGLIVPPHKRGNRTFALIVAVIATIVFAGLYAFAFSAARFIFTPGADILGDAWAFAGTAAFYVPVTLFAVVMILWSVLSNRAGWWSYILASLLIALIAFAGHYVGIAGQEVINGGAWSNQALFDAVRAPENLPGALIAFIAARESANWIGGLIAARGRRVAKLNKRDMDDYERRVAEERELSGIATPEPMEKK